MERQNKMMMTLMQAMKINTNDDTLPPMATRRSIDLDGGQFAVGDSDDEDGRK